MIEERLDFKRHLAEEKEEVTDQFLDLMEDLVTFLLSKQKQLLSQLNDMHELHLKAANDQIKRCKKIQNETSVCLKQLKVGKILA